MATADTVWGYWTEGTASATTSTCEMYADGYDSTSSSTTTATVWSSWVSTTGEGTVSGVSSDGVWGVWVSSGEANTVYVSSTPTLSPEEERARKEEVDRRMREADDRRKKEQLEREVAEETAKELLLELIGPEELEIYDETGRLFVKGRKFDYIIQNHGKLQRLEKDKITDLCVHLQAQYKFPRTDNVIALLMMLMTDEDYVLNLANNHGSRDKPIELPKFARAA